MTSKQERFCTEYIISGGNSSEAARAAGYSANSAKVTGSRLKNRADVREAIDTRINEISSSKVADAQEIMEYLSSVMRGDCTDEVATPSGKIVRIQVNTSSRLKAAETLAKIYGMFKREDEPKESGAELLTATLLKIERNMQEESAQD